MADITTDADTASPERSPIRQVLADRSFRRFWLAMFLASLVNGNLRFAFVWLALDISDWSPVAGIIGFSIGLPALLISLPAGAWSDRVDRSTLVVRLSTAGGAALAVTASLEWSNGSTVFTTAVLALVAGAALAGQGPALQAMVPSLVPPELLQQGVALQQMGMTIAIIAGAIVSGAAIKLFGIGGGFAVLAGLAFLSAVIMATVELPPQEMADKRRRLRADVAEGLRFVLHNEPMRSLVAIALIAGFGGGVVQLMLPDIVREDLGRDALDAGLLFGAMGIGMFCTATIIASRPIMKRRGLVIMLALSLIAGTGMVVIGISDQYWLTALAMFGWGLGGGLVLTTQRGLLQEATPNELMGRVMGANSLAMAGSLPIAAIAAGSIAAVTSSADAVWILGLVVAVGAWAVSWRRPIREA